MPYSVGKDERCPASKPWAVTNSTTKAVVACHMTKAMAQKQQRALYANVPDAGRSSVAEVSKRDGRDRKADMTPEPLKTFWRAADYDLDLSRSRKGNPILAGELVRYDEWVEIKSPIEPPYHFLERYVPSVFKKTLLERMSKLRVLFQHGTDPQIGKKPLGIVRSMPSDRVSQRYEVELFNVSYVDDLLPALERGQYGSSFQARDIRSPVVFRAAKSNHNPEGIPEVTREELAMWEFGPVTFPANDAGTAHVRSITDDHMLPGLAELLEPLGLKIPVVRAATLEPEDEPDPAAEPEPEAEPDEEATPPDDEPEHSAEEDVDTKREEEPPPWQLRR